MQVSVPVKPGKVYHLYNRGNNREDLFRDEADYRKFLRLYIEHIHGVADTFAYCLMRNHFHIMIKVRSEPRAAAMADEFRMTDANQSFSNFFNAYAKTFNNRHRRTGRLFEERFRRIEVDSETYFRQLAVYIHRNPQRHGFVPDFRSWEWSSYSTLCSVQPTKLEREEVLRWFGGLDQFKAAHLPDGDDSALGAYISDDPN